MEATLMEVPPETATTTPEPVSNGNGTLTQNGHVNPKLTLKYIALSEIRQSDLNPRTIFEDEGIDELADSIAEHGLLQPLTLRKLDKAEDGVKYEIIAGARRFRALTKNGAETAPCTVRGDVSDSDLVALALIENLKRTDLDPIEEAQGYGRLRDYGKSVAEIAKLVSRSQPAVSNTMRLLRLPETVQQMIRGKELTAGHGIALAALADVPEECERLARAAAEGRWTTKHTETVAQSSLAAHNAKVNPPLLQTPPPAPAPPAPAVVAESEGESEVSESERTPEPPAETDSAPNAEEEEEAEETGIKAETTPATPIVPTPNVIPAPDAVPAPATRATQPAPAPAAASTAPRPAQTAPPAPTPTPPPAPATETALVADLITVPLPQAHYTWMSQNGLKPKTLIPEIQKLRGIVTPEIDGYLTSLTNHFNESDGTDFTPTQYLSLLLHEKAEEAGLLPATDTDTDTDTDTNTNDEAPASEAAA